jgi:hypothetical protein
MASDDGRIRRSVKHDALGAVEDLAREIAHAAVLWHQRRSARDERSHLGRDGVNPQVLAHPSAGHNMNGKCPHATDHPLVPRVQALWVNNQDDVRVPLPRDLVGQASRHLRRPSEDRFRIVFVTSDAGDKYLTTQALEWFDGVKSRFWSWLFDEEQGYKHTTAIVSFILGALVVHIVPDAFTYAGVAAGLLIFFAFLVACLIPIALLVEWALRKVSGW